MLKIPWIIQTRKTRRRQSDSVLNLTALVDMQAKGCSPCILRAPEEQTCRQSRVVHSYLPDVQGTSVGDLPVACQDSWQRWGFGHALEATMGCWSCGITHLRVSALHQAESTLRECVILTHRKLSCKRGKQCPSVAMTCSLLCSMTFSWDYSRPLLVHVSA